MYTVSCSLLCSSSYIVMSSDVLLSILMLSTSSLGWFKGEADLVLLEPANLQDEELDEEWGAFTDLHISLHRGDGLRAIKNVHPATFRWSSSVGPG